MLTGYPPGMAHRPDITRIASAIGERARGKILNALMDGRALTATELALDAGVTPSTASSHLAKLQQAGLISLAVQGRHRYFRIATAEVAELLESMMGMVAVGGTIRCGPRDDGLRRARVCYDHLAGELGVAMFQRMRERQLIRGDGQFLELTVHGETRIAELGVDLHELRRKARPLVRSCLDWSERRSHLAGAVGAAILARLFELRFARRDPMSRAVVFSARGEAFFTSLELPRRAMAQGNVLR
jgi:DNA-binding transcriptional ArsR family regulator